jgi:predicted transcriptional regulator
MAQAKEAVRRLLDDLPAEATLEDIQYHIYVQQAVQQGFDAADRGELVDQEEIERRMAKWLGAEGGLKPHGRISRQLQATSRG